jgi:predicted GTPase
MVEDISVLRRHSTVRQRAVVGIDGKRYPPEVEDELNLLAARVLGSHDGQRLMAYLRNITMNVAFENDVSTNALLHMEGQRWLVGLMAKRAQLGAAR